MTYYKPFEDCDLFMDVEEDPNDEREGEGD